MTKPKWTTFQLGDEDSEVHVRVDRDEDGKPFLDVQAVGATIAVRPEASNHFRLYFWRELTDGS
jgi:hypothetical protein